VRGLVLRFVSLLAIGTAAFAPVTLAQAPAQNSHEVDRIVARIENDIILESQVRELAAFQTLIEGHAESDDRLIQELIEQWEVQTEAGDAHYPQPAQSELDRELDRLMAKFGTPAAYTAKVQQLGLSVAEVRRLLAQQIYVERYLDYKFRAAVQIESGDIEAYYQNELVPQLKAKNQPVPPLADVQDQIRELLTQKEISNRAAQWLDDTKSRLKIEIQAPGSEP
jgi:hypothetical protein